ncbi:hypothetical protein CC78DRAFT_533596 [Lojkania enalia]|uniref:Uncharacterized protein n=1 Tax=Lojkania enalia TaxID=147567 RepID=A0A9P4K715_9PLEO|nr:hypothetical protein CC78DRAFT_533596 [Didymosphaeria enalia]
MSVKLPHTLQTWAGMVMDNGQSAYRRTPAKIASLDPSAYEELSQCLPGWRLTFEETQEYQPASIVLDAAARYLRNPSRFGMSGSEFYTNVSLRYYASNLKALTNNVDKEDLKEYMRTRTRFDLEQAAAIVVSAFMKNGRTEDAVQLIRELGTLLATSAMWMTPGGQSQLPMRKNVGSLGKKFSCITKILRSSASAQGKDVPLVAITTYRDILPLLLRVRRRKPEDRCLHIPQWLFDEAAPTDRPACFEKFFQDVGARGGESQFLKGSLYPIAPKDDDAIVLSRREFHRVERRVYALFPFWKPPIVLRRRIRELEDQVLYAGSWIEGRVFAVDDIALLCHYFFHFQRRLQRRVVSDMRWSSFLGKSESAKVYQNNTRITSTFEQALLDIAEQNQEGVLVAMGDENTLRLIDETCLLMKEYVDVYGGGKTENLTFKKGVHGGSGRGPVDEYNLLCDILGQLRQQAIDEGIGEVPGPTKKFLAKDIMFWNNAWEDDAFAGGKKPGWKEWLLKRGLMYDQEWGVVEKDDEKGEWIVADVNDD